MSKRPPLSDQERAQIRTLVRFLMFVLIAVAIASVGVGVALSIVNSGQEAPALTSAP